MMNNEISDFKISINNNEIRDLKKRLRETRWLEEPPDPNWIFGADPYYIRNLIRYWLNEYDWEKQEKQLNAFKGFITEVDGLKIHFLHEPGKGKKSYPLILLHGWPTTCFEMKKIIPMLTDPVLRNGLPEDSFNVVVPSLPGFGFSDVPGKGGMNYRKIGDVLGKLMFENLGYKKFFVHGVDWGLAVASWIGLKYEKNVMGLHICGVMPTKEVLKTSYYNKIRKEYNTKREIWQEYEGGYHHIQRTKPRNLAFALNDSPAGLAAWIIEKYRAWSDCNGDIESRFSKDELINNVMIYWFTKSVSSSIRIYAESMHNLVLDNNEKIKVPSAVALFPKDVDLPPKIYAELVYNLKRWTVMPRGGHFPAMEEPELLVNDLRSFIRELK